MVISNEDIIRAKLPHLLKYMGSKREIIDFIEESIIELDVDSKWLCDLFSGSSIVAGTLNYKFNIHANDIQIYSGILAKTYLSDFGHIKLSFLDEVEDKAIELTKQLYSKYPELVFNYKNNFNLVDFALIEKEQQQLIDKDFGIGFHLFTKYYSGTYWSFDQCVWIDSLRAVAEQYTGKPEYYVILSSLIFAMSYTSQSTGHYAQYRDPLTNSSMTDILSYRERDIWPYFEKKFIELISIPNFNSQEFKVTSLDYLDCLRIIDDNSIVYADPPYQSVHYSRFYHVLETLVKYDYPKVEYKGRYREDRHQSPFCKKTTVNKAFESLFEGVFLKNSHLVLSYSDTGMITLDEINFIADKVFSKKYTAWVKVKDHVHSKMGRSDVRTQDVKEYTLLFRRK